MTIVEDGEHVRSSPTRSAGGSPGATVLPSIVATPLPPHSLRTLGGWSRNDFLVAGGALMSSFCVTMLLFGNLTSLSGSLGFVVVVFVLFNVTYALLVSMTEDGPAVVDKVMSVLMGSAAAAAIGALASVIIYTFARGGSLLARTNLYVQDMGATGPLDPLSKGGIAHAIVGTVIIIAICLVVTVPLGIACAVFLNETPSRATSVIRTVVDAMTALPSIVAGLFVFATFILILGFERSGIAAAVAVSIVMLPIIVRSSEVVLRLVAGNLREASAALGAPLWRTVWHVVLPTARPGLATAIILGVARGVGETAPVLLTSGVTGNMNLDPTKAPMMSLPLATFEFVRSPQQSLQTRGFATAAVLMVLVLLLFTLARVLGGRPAGQVTKRQAQRLAARSRRDVRRFEARHSPPVGLAAGIDQGMEPSTP